MTHNVDNLMNLHTDVLYNIILYRYMPAKDLCSFSQVSKAGYSAIQAIATFPQQDISLKLRVSFKKDGAFISLEGEGNDNVFDLSDKDSKLFDKIQELAKKNGIKFDRKSDFAANGFVALVRKDIYIPFEAQNQTVSTLIFHRFRIETLLQHIECMRDSPDEESIEGINADKFIFYRTTLEALCIMQTNLYEAKDLESAFKAITDHYGTHTALSTSYPEHAANIAKLLFRHPEAKTLPAGHRAAALIATIGENWEFQQVSAHTKFDITAAFKPEKFMFDTVSEWIYNVTPPSVLLEKGKTKNLTIPKLILSHPDAANTFYFSDKDQLSDYKVEYDIRNILLCAVRYRDPGLVQTILSNPYAENLHDDDLARALHDANDGGELKSAKAILAFQDKRAEEKNKKEAERPEVFKAIEEIVQAVTEKIQPKEKTEKIPHKEKEDKCVVS